MKVELTRIGIRMSDWTKRSGNKRASNGNGQNTVYIVYGKTIND